MTPLEIFLAEITAHLGAPYIWPTAENHYSGKALKGSTYPEGRDCSGLVTAALHHTTLGRLDWRANVNAVTLYAHCKPLASKAAGPCLVFYGHGKNAISHVVVKMPDGTCIGAQGGSSDCTTPAIAAARGAKVKRLAHEIYGSRTGLKLFYAEIPL